MSLENPNFVAEQERIKKLPHRMVDGVAVAFSEEELEILFAPADEQETLNNLKAFKIEQCQQYLKDTKWYVERFTDPSSLKPIPEHVLANRKFAREVQDKIEKTKSLKTLENINTTFA